MNESAVARVPTRLWWVVAGAWLLAIVFALLGMLDSNTIWPPWLATLHFGWLLAAPFFFILSRTYARPPETGPSRYEWAWLTAIAAVALVITGLTSRPLHGLPPAYHDEYSYLLQATLLCEGRISTPRHPTQPRLFDQMHVLNEDRVASRYYPGTGLFLAPFIALERPYMGYAFANSAIALLAYVIGRRLDGRVAGRIAGFVTALSPGNALFASLLLSSTPCLLALMVFQAAFLQWQHAAKRRWLVIAGCGLACGMLCRPATAAAIGLPYGLWLVGQAAWAPRQQRWHSLANLAAIGTPVLFGLGTMVVWNHGTTGDWRQSPYQLYTQLYSPRHQYGFYNVSRAPQHEGPQTLTDYNNWATEHTPSRAVLVAAQRWICAWGWSYDLLILLVVLGVAPFVFGSGPTSLQLPLAAILCLHAIHVPYWYEGIMGWHYVFETGPLWAVVVGVVFARIDRAGTNETAARRCIWGLSWLALGGLAGVVPGPIEMGDEQVTVHWLSRLDQGINTLRFARKSRADVLSAIAHAVRERPALLLLDQTGCDPHLDLVVNMPPYDAPLLWARDPGTPVARQAAAAAFPERATYLVHVATRRCQRVR